MANSTRKTASKTADAADATSSTDGAPDGVLTLDDAGARPPESGPSNESDTPVTLTHKESGGKVTVPERLVSKMKAQGFK